MIDVHVGERAKYLSVDSRKTDMQSKHVNDFTDMNR